MNNPSHWIARFAELLPAGEVLDLACGRGRHAHLLAALGHPVLALDCNALALVEAAGQGITTMAFDLEDGTPWPFAPGRFSGIVVSNYLHRALLAPLIGSLAPNGVLIYETFARGNDVFGKPSNPSFLLEPGELLALAHEQRLQVLAFEEGVTGSPQAAMVQRLCAAGADFPRPKAWLGPGKPFF